MSNQSNIGKLTKRLRNHYYNYDTETSIAPIYLDSDRKYLDYGYQGIKVLSTRIDYSKLVNIDVSNNFLKELSFAAPHLKYLNASRNQLTSIPLFPKLEVLIATDNQLTGIDNYNNSILRQLHISSNEIRVMSINLPQLTNLQMDDCKLKSIDITRYKSLKYASLNNNRLTSIRSHDVVKDLSIENNCLTSLPAFPKGRCIEAKHNMIKNIQFGSCKILSISGNALSNLPTCTSLVECYLENNVSECGLTVQDQPNMESLFLTSSNGEITLGKMNKLTTLNISNTSIKSVSFASLTTLFCLTNHLVIVQQCKLTEINCNYKTYLEIMKCNYPFTKIDLTISKVLFDKRCSMIMNVELREFMQRNLCLPVHIDKIESHVKELADVFCGNSNEKVIKIMMSTLLNSLCIKMLV